MEETKKVKKLELSHEKTGEGNSGNVDKIRDILFGSQMREYEKRFVRLEERTQKDISSLKEELLKNFESLEHFMKKEIELLNERQENEQNERFSAIQKVSEELKSSSLTLENKISQTEDKLNKRARDLHEEILAQSKSLSEEIRQKHETISELLEREAEELRFDKVDRSDLSELFMEMAMRLSNKADMKLDLCSSELINE